MKIIGRNDPCPCGSGKKYKKCCQLKDETANFEIFRYEKYLSIRASAAEKMMNIAQNKIGITLADVLSFLTYSPIFNERKIDLFSYHEDEAILIQFITNSILMYAYPVDNLSNNLLWKHCLNEYRNKFSQEEVSFLRSLENYTAGFFQAKETDNNKEYLVVAEDIFTSNIYKIMDKGLCKGIIKNDIFCGMIVPYNKDTNILEGGSPTIFPPLEKEYIKETVNILYKLNKRKLPGNGDERLSKFLNLFPINIYRTVLDYYYLTLEKPQPKIMTTDNEELVFSKTFYKLSDMQKVKSSLLKMEGFTISEENEKEIIISWCNKKDTILGTIFLNNDELCFETNSLERLEKWESSLKEIPIEFVKTEYIDFEKIIKERSGAFVSDDEDLKEEKINDISEEALRDFALDYWNKYYDNWIKDKIPFLDNKTPLEAIKTEKGKQKVIDLIDDFENKNLHMIQKSGGGNIQRFFNADELRKRLNL